MLTKIEMEAVIKNGGSIVHAGEIITRVEDLPDDGSTPVKAAGSEPDGSEDFDTTAYTVANLKDAISAIEDRDELQAIREHESANKQRDSALDAIDARIAELS